MPVADPDAGGVIYPRLITGKLGYSCQPRWGVTVWNNPTTTFLTLAEAEAEFERIPEGQIEMAMSGSR
jgi:hypothetical protein